MSEISVRAIVLRRRELGDADRSLTIFTKELGLLNVIARGARKAESRLSGATEPLVLATLQIAMGRRSHYVTQAQPHDSFPKLRFSYERLSLGVALAELYAACNPEGQIASQAYDLLELSLKSLESNEIPEPTFIWACLRLLMLEGLGPSWTQCAVCGTRLAENPAIVSPEAGGYVSAPHVSKFADRFFVSAETLICLEKTMALGNPPARLKESDSCINTLYRFWLAAAHKALPAFAAVALPSKLGL